MLFHVNPGESPTLAFYEPRTGVRVRFADGSYETADHVEIAALRRCSRVFSLDDLQDELRGPSYIDELAALEPDPDFEPAPEAPDDEDDEDEDDEDAGFDAAP